MERQELLALIDQAAAEGWTELDLSGQGLTELPAEIAKLTQLETLILGKVEKWVWVDDGPVPMLVTNALTTLPPELAALENLKQLDLSGNPLTVISKAIFELRELEQLMLASVDLSKIPDEIGQLTNLTELFLHSNRISEIPEVIGQLTNLTVLAIQRNQINLIPNCLGQLINLTDLYLWGNQVTEIPQMIGQLTNLTVLSLLRNQISQIPEVIGQLTNLTMLSLNRNQISQIPEVICQSSKLEQLHLSSNQISQIPEAIGQLSNLTELDLGGNQISQIPESIGQLTHLTTLYLWGNQISQIPEAIGQLSNLTELSLHSNQISEIPKVIGQLSNLTMLSLGRNQISEIPKVIGQLTNLTQLYLHSNQISQIPEAIGQLTNLEKLDLKVNKIAILPDWLEQLPNLKTLDLRRNPLPISPEILGPTEQYKDPGSVTDIFNYLRQLRSGTVRPLNEAKLLLVGQGSVGKTSLINRLLHQHFNPQEAQTDGLNVQSWIVHVNSKDVRLNVWDFGGQEIYHATHQFFLTKRSLYLLVCNCRTSEDENRIEYWLKLIESFGDQSPVIIIGNKCDEQPLDINRRALRDKYPNIKAILETSCQDNQGIDDLRTAILKEVSQLKEVYDLLPLTWFEVKEQLESMKEDFISYGKYACICQSNSVSEERNQEQLVDLLHRLGLVLSFRTHPILQSTNVLNPDWVTQGIYTILSDHHLKTETHGILSPADLSRILDSHRYPADRHHYLIELMKEFQLCFELSSIPQSPSSPGEGLRVRSTVLIPGLLPKEEPADTRLEGDTLDFQYHYTILPASILARFIVLTHDKIHNHTYWRTGVMLAYREGSEPCNIARIKSDPEDKKIFIAIDGRPNTRRLFLGIIRDVFSQIHTSFGNLEVSEWVPVPGHPDHPPLDYQELLGLEDMGESQITIGKLKLKLNLRQLLDGYEPIEARQRRHRGDREFDAMIEEHHHYYGDVIRGDKVGNDKVGNDKVGNDKIQYQ